MSRSLLARSAALALLLCLLSTLPSAAFTAPAPAGLETTLQGVGATEGGRVPGMLLGAGPGIAALAGSPISGEWLFLLLACCVGLGPAIALVRPSAS